MTDSYKEQLVNMAVEIRDDVVEEMAPPENPECEICGAKRFQVQTLKSDSGIDFYKTECWDRNCDGTVIFAHLYVRVGDDFPIKNEEFRTDGCSNPECSYSNPLGDMANEADPMEENEYHLPIKGIVTTRMIEHHTSYVPEETMLVCSGCHGKIHHRDDFRPDLEPDMTRKEWEEEYDV